MGFIEHAPPEGLSKEMGEQRREGKASKQGVSLSWILWELWSGNHTSELLPAGGKKHWTFILLLASVIG